MQLLGSTTSPFVRRLRLYLVDIEHEFINLDIFSEQGREILTANNPAQKVPALIDGELCVYDSRVIYRYFAEKFSETKLTWEQENLLTLIDAANDSFVTLLLSMRSGIDVEQDVLFYNLQRERVEKVLSVLAQECEQGAFDTWSYPSICLFCLLDWIEFRELYDWKRFPPLYNFYCKSQQRKGIKETDPRIS